MRIFEKNSEKGNLMIEHASETSNTFIGDVSVNNSERSITIRARGEILR
jgi:hypothetical protein